MMVSQDLLALKIIFWSQDRKGLNTDVFCYTDFLIHKVDRDGQILKQYKHVAVKGKTSETKANKHSPYLPSCN